MKKIKEETAGTSATMIIELDNGEIVEVTNYCGINYRWDTYKTTFDGNEEKRVAAIEAFKKLY